MLVVDASVVVAFLIDPSRRNAIRARFLEGGDDLHAPAHLDLEVLSALRRLVLAGRLPDSRASAAARDLTDLPLVRHPIEPLVDTVWALRGDITPYDAAYVAAARRNGWTLVSTDIADLASKGLAVTPDAADYP